MHVRRVATGLIGGVFASVAGIAPVFATDDHRDLPAVMQTVNSTLETQRSGIPVSWTNPATGNRGTVTVIRTFYRADGTPCREYKRTTERASGPPLEVTGTGCRAGAGFWRLDEKAAEKPPKTTTEAKRPPPPSSRPPSRPPPPESTSPPPAKKPDRADLPPRQDVGPPPGGGAPPQQASKPKFDPPATPPPPGADIPKLPDLPPLPDAPPADVMPDAGPAAPEPRQAEKKPAQSDRGKQGSRSRTITVSMPTASDDWTR